eukprot:TRINITY_DN2834_c0_g1_i2.p1 TRINITY_DN2834_c0_g1~~TRINITY_DN2834_c0_g1_i2.p1  ORF type:complete len:334 (+),score=119.78 TRINITY_DN2834_c0_g1_i2:52-1002(+)
MSEYKGSSGEGRRAAAQKDQRKDQLDNFQQAKEKIKKDLKASGLTIGEKFASVTTTTEGDMNKAVYGLVSKEDYARKRKNAALDKESEKDAEKAEKAANKQKKKKRRKQKSKTTLSFGDEEEESDIVFVKKHSKDPTANTGFLPDRMRDAEAVKERERLKVEWEKEQEKLKDEDVTVTYSYWDGAGHRRVVTLKKGDTIERLLDHVRLEFKELRGMPSSDLMYVKEDIIIPINLSFYDLIVNKARGKSGPLFKFDVRDDVRLINDSRKEKEETHAGKVIERRWYDRNKHIFPASRWEVFDPEKKFDEYTVHGGEMQ